MSTSSERLAEALARRLNEVAPTGFLIQADGESVAVRTESRTLCREGAAMILTDDDGRTMGEKIGTATRQVLSGVQDCIIREIRERWPAPSGSGGLPYPNAQVIGESVRLWYGEESDPVLTFSPIPFDEVVDP